MPTVLDFNPAVDPSELVDPIREAIARGSAVVLPGDCGYVALINPASPTATARIANFKSPAILAWGPDDPAGLGLPLPLAARRLLSRGWPAPLVVAIPGTAQWPAHWPASIRAALSVDGTVRFRCPEHPMFEVLAPMLELPVLVADTFLPSVEAVLDLLDDPDAFAVSVGERASEGKPTVVTANSAGYTIAELGLLPADEIEKLAARIVLFVCTGNTCRSPMAEGLAKHMLAERLGCSAEDLPRHGVWVLSAGVSTIGEGPASPEAVAVVSEFGADLSGHLSRLVNGQLLAAADDVIAMTRGHAQTLATRFPGVGPVPTLLCAGADLDDPIGAGLDVYRQCVRTIRTNLERLIPEWIGK